MRAPRLAAVVLASMLALASTQAVVAVVWREPVTAAYSALRGDPLAGRIDAALRTGPSPPERRALGSIRGEAGRLAFLARSARRRVADGDPVARLRIPALGLSEVVGEGAGGGHLRRGPSHDPRTGLPGGGTAVVIGGHRVAFGAPFRDLGELRPGNRVLVDVAYGSFAYEVEAVGDAAAGARPAGDGEALVLAAADPPLAGGGRLVVTARLRTAKPRVDTSTKRDRPRLRRGRPGR